MMVISYNQTQIILGNLANRPSSLVPYKTNFVELLMKMSMSAENVE